MWKTKQDLLAMSEEQLDELVHDAKAQEAADINNSGKDDQIAYLMGETDSKEVAAEEACRMLCDAYDNGEKNGGSMEWSDVDRAWEKAKEATGR